MTTPLIVLAVALAAALATCVVLGLRLYGYRSLGLSVERDRAHLDQLVEHSPEAIVLVDPQDRVQRINQEFTRMFGYTTEEALGRFINDLIAPEQLRDEAAGVTRRVTQGDNVALETMRRRKDGTNVHVSILGTPVMGRSGQIAAYGIYRDITDRKIAEDQLLHFAVRDELTGLANRALFRDLVSRSIGRGKRRADYHCAVLVLDIDRWDPLESTCRHASLSIL